MPQPEDSRRQAIAPAWHTLLLIAVMLFLSLLGAHSQHKFSGHYGRNALYSLTMAFELALLGYVVWGVRRRGVKLRELAGGRWSSVEDGMLDVALGIAVYIATALLLYVLARAMGMLGNAPQTLREAKEKLDFVAPQSGLQLGWFIVLCAVAAVCEEIIFRGYFQRQFAALSRSVAAGIVIQALLFGAAHGYEGRKRMVMIAAYGVLLGVVAHWRKSLRPGIFAHFFQDSVAGVLLRLLR
jgi:membrane protease YdiL (CAAX protease family)